MFFDLLLIVINLAIQVAVNMQKDLNKMFINAMTFKFSANYFRGNYHENTLCKIQNV